MRFTKTLLTTKWLWIIIFSGFGILLLPFAAVYVYLWLPCGWVKVVALTSLLAAAGVAAGIKDYRST